MKKNLIFYTFMLVALMLSAQLQAAIPQPLLQYDCEEITNLNQLEPSTGSIIAKITDGSSALKNDASIETDADRGKVLLLPNFLDGNNKGDQPGFYRCLRIESTESLVGTGDFTLAFWAKVRTQTSPLGLNGFPAMFEFDEAGATFAMRHIDWSTVKTKLCLRTNKDINSTADAVTFIHDWSLYVIVKEGSNLKLYINNTLIGSNTTYNIANTSLKKLRFNGSAHGGGTLLDDIQIFGTALSAAQIAEIYDPNAKANISATAYPAAGGSISGTGDIAVGTQHTVTATANPNYQFAWWAENGYTVSTDPAYSFGVSTGRQLYAYFKPNVPEDLPNFKITGTNYNIETFAKGKTLFLNRTMVFGDIPAEFANWKFTKINANSTTNPGPLPAIQVKPDKNGYIYALVANGEKPEVCASWATTNGWELAPVYKISYGASELEKLMLYKKQVTKDALIDVVQPNTFSGAIIIAPDISVGDAISTVAVRIESEGGYLKVANFASGDSAFSNRNFVLSTISPRLQGTQFTRINGGEAPKLSVKALADGDLYVAIADGDVAFSRVGWTKIDNLRFTYSGGGNNIFDIYKKSVLENEITKIETTSWYGVLVISSSIHSVYVINAGQSRTYNDYIKGSYGDIIIKSDETSTGQLTGIPAGKLTVNGVVKYQKTFTPKKWYPIGFSFAIESIYCAGFEDDMVDGPWLDIYDGTTADNGTKGDFWLKNYNGSDFEYAGEFEAGKGYAIQFPSVFNGKEITFISEPNPVLSNTNTPVPALASGYTLIANPSVANAPSIVGAQHYYMYNYETNGKFNVLYESNNELPSGTSLKPFEAMITVKDVEAIDLRSVSVKEQETEIDGIDVADDQVIETRYYNLQGIEIYEPATNGIYLVKKIYESKKVEIVKTLINKK